MKTQRIFLLLTLIALVFTLASCGAGNNNAAPDCFDFEEDAIFTDVTEYEGSCLDINTDAGVIALASTKLDSYGNGDLIRTVQVIDITDGNRVIWQDSENVSADSIYGYSEISLDSYPVIRIEKQTSVATEDGSEPDKYTYRYYLAHTEGSATHLATEDFVEKKWDNNVLSKVNNVYIADVDDTIYWIGKDLEVIREFPAIVSDSYTSYYEGYFDIKAEYNDFLYTWSFDAAIGNTVILVYDPNGVCCAKYNFTPGTLSTESGDTVIEPKIYVLNNGDVLVQEFVEAKDGEEYDLAYSQGPSKKLIMNTKIITHYNGEVTDVDFNYIIADLESAYSRESENSEFPFALTADYANQAYLVPIENGLLGKSCDYAVLSDTLEIKYTLPNEYLAISGNYSEIMNAGEDGYYASAYVDGSYTVAKFDWAGNVTYKIPVNAIGGTSDDYYWTESGIYKIDGTVVFDIENSMFANDEWCPVYSFNNVLYLERYRFELDESEFYAINLSDGTTTLVADGIDSFISDECFDTLDGAGISEHCLIVENYKDGTTSYYDSEGKLALVVSFDNLYSMEKIDDAYVVTIEIDGGRYKTFVFGDKTVVDEAESN